MMAVSDACRGMHFDVGSWKTSSSAENSHDWCLKKIRTPCLKPHMSVSPAVIIVPKSDRNKESTTNIDPPEISPKEFSDTRGIEGFNVIVDMVIIDVQKFEDFRWLNAWCVPMLEQLQDSEISN
ncbi:hypothetical protein VNO77_20001 [Canavalia gladiata]|uniref:Uncharacterized protein n=1 Tax=Canavalia gladiata TaxID=3824 RepID=A0AAN9LNI4_CANGL